MKRRRIDPLARERWGADKEQTLDDTAAPVSELEGKGTKPAGDAKPLNILGTIAHHPTLLEPFLGFAATLAMRGVLTRRQSELLALRAAWNCQSAFEWGHPVIYARTAGLDDEEIARVPDGTDAEGWSQEERDLLRAADELHAGHDLSESTWSRLRERFDDAQLVEIPFVVGNYTMLSMVANATGVPLEEDLPPLPTRR
jgi:4-carboxymuconolactone decarboxylase